MSCVARFEAYASDFECAFADRDWSRLGPHFAADAVYECSTPVELAFRVEGRAAILARFETVTEAFDRHFDSRAISFHPPCAEGRCVSVEGVVVYTLAGAPPLHLPFVETAHYEGAEIVRLEDTASPGDFRALRDWLECYGDRLLQNRSAPGSRLR